MNVYVDVDVLFSKCEALTLSGDEFRCFIVVISDTAATIWIQISLREDRSANVLIFAAIL